MKPEESVSWKVQISIKKNNLSKWAGKLNSQKKKLFIKKLKKTKQKGTCSCPSLTSDRTRVNSQSY